jgi:hypothetical protein
MNRLHHYLTLIAAALTLALSVSAQGLPEKIRGYKVHDEVIRVTNNGAKSDGKPAVVVGSPAVSDVSLSGVTLAIAGEIEAAGHDGRVEMMTFRDFRVNGMAVKVAEFDTPFILKKRGKTTLPAPATVFLPTTNILNAAWKEITESKNDWTVTGRVFVFGRFKRFGFNFKRVIPIDVSLTIKNPFLEYRNKVLPGISAS